MQVTRWAWRAGLPWEEWVIRLLGRVADLRVEVLGRNYYWCPQRVEEVLALVLGFPVRSLWEGVLWTSSWLLQVALRLGFPGLGLQGARLLRMGWAGSRSPEEVSGLVLRRLQAGSVGRALGSGAGRGCCLGASLRAAVVVAAGRVYLSAVCLCCGGWF
jgi:hypothetical protein